MERKRGRRWGAERRGTGGSGERRGAGRGRRGAGGGAQEAGRSEKEGIQLWKRAGSLGDPAAGLLTLRRGPENLDEVADGLFREIGAAWAAAVAVPLEGRSGARKPKAAGLARGPREAGEVRVGAGQPGDHGGLRVLRARPRLTSFLQRRSGLRARGAAAGIGPLSPALSS